MVLSGCNDDDPVGPGPSDDTELSGKIEQARITLAEGVEYRAIGDLEMVATEMLEVAGTLVIEEGVTVTLISLDTLVVTGSVISEDTLAIGKRAGSGDGARTHAAPANLVLGGARMTIGGNSLVPRSFTPTGSIFIGGLEGPGGSIGALTITNATMLGGAGAPGTAANRDGSPGGSVEIGTAAAQNMASAGRGRAGGPFPSIKLVGRIEMRGGTGGAGYSIVKRSEGVVSGNVLTVTQTGKGARGGSVTMAATNTLGMEEVTTIGLFGGNGGSGGSVGFTGVFGEETILDGSGPNGEGESLTGTTGSGFDGGDVSLIAGNLSPGGELAASGGRGGGPGFFAARGGNGIQGGAGGNFTARIGIPGVGGMATVVGVQQPNPDPADLAVVRVDGSMNGGDAPNNATNGGAGGKLDVVDITGGPAHVMPVFANAAASGGFGFNGCALVPITNGTNGGPGGTYKALGRALAEVAGNSWDGGRGGPGEGPGDGGAEGRNLDTNQPLGDEGLDGLPCPPSASYISVDKKSLAFTHVVGGTACPQRGATVRVTNVSNTEVMVTSTAVNTNSIFYDQADFSFFLGPGEFRDVDVLFNCNRQTSFEGTVRFVAQTRAQEQLLDIPLAVTIVR